MVIACDTSFLFPLYGSDAHSPKAVAWVSRNTRALHLNSLTHFEFGNALRFSEFRQVTSSDSITNGSPAATQDASSASPTWPAKWCGACWARIPANKESMLLGHV